MFVHPWAPTVAPQLTPEQERTLRRSEFRQKCVRACKEARSELDLDQYISKTEDAMLLFYLDVMCPIIEEEINARLGEHGDAPSEAA